MRKKVKIKSIKTINKELKRFKKRCIHCKKIKFLNEFTKRKDCPDGHSNVCKVCSRERKKDRSSKNRIYITEKKCSKCKKIKPVSEFRRQSASIDGYQSQCKECVEKKYSFTCITCGKEFTSHHNDRKYCSYECSIKKQIGEKNWMWNSELTEEHREQNRNIKGYREFIKNVSERDDYTCQNCGEVNPIFGVVHHLNSYDWCEELRCDVDNGIYLCEECHKKFHKIYGRFNNTICQWLDFIRFE